MPLSWSTLSASQLCIVTGEATVTRADIDAYLTRAIREGTQGYAKLVDMTACTLALDTDDLEAVAGRLVRYGRGDRPGPIAVVVGSALNLDMAVLLKQRVGDRPFRIFTSIGAARWWLAAYQKSHAAAFATGLGTRGRSLRVV